MILWAGRAGDRTWCQVCPDHFDQDYVSYCCHILNNTFAYVEEGWLYEGNQCSVCMLWRPPTSCKCEVCYKMRESRQKPVKYFPSGNVDWYSSRNRV